MNIKNVNQIITNNGDTSDIINVVMYAYDIEKDPQIKVLAEKLKANTDFDTCKNIWKYLIENVKYKADSEGNSGEMVRTPARLLVDGTGDCKSYSLFTAVILRWLGIPHVFRFVSYGKNKEATHVYVVATDKNIVIDAVSAVQLNTSFNHEIKFTYKCDMANGGTRISYLAGFQAHNKKYTNPNGKRVFIGDVNSNRYSVWIGDEHAANVTPGKHFLYSLLDLNVEMLNISTTPKDKLQYLNNLDVIASLLHAYDVVGGDTDKFKEIAHLICCLVTDGYFKSKELDFENRYQNLDDLYVIIEEQFAKGYNYTAPDAELWSMIQSEVLPYNKLLSSGISGIAGESDVISKIKEAGIYYIYLYTDAKSQLPEVVKTKTTKQQKTFDWMDDVNTYQTTQAMQLTIRSGIVARTGQTPEQFIANLKAGKSVNGVNKIGEFITIALAVISIITGLIKIIQAIWPPKPKPSDSEIIAGTFDPETDFGTNGGSGSDSGNGISASLTSWGLPIALGGALLFGLMKKN